MAWSVYLAHLNVYAFGFLIRLIVLNSVSLRKFLENRVEISTPLTSWKRAVEGAYLKRKGVNPYDGDVFHESPLALNLYSYILNYPEEWISVIFAVVDLITAAALSYSSSKYLDHFVKKENDPSKFPPSASSFLLKPSDIKWVPFYISAIYLLCPYSIAVCGGKSTAIFFNAVTSFFILFVTSDCWPLASVFLSVLTYHSFYHVSLIVPLVMYIYQMNLKKSVSTIVFKVIGTILIFASSLASLIFASYNLVGSWNFLWSTYGCILSVPDLTPNIGLFWYFFTEMFEHFRVFFLYIFHLNVFIYSAPLAIRFRNEPVFLLFMHLVIIAIFKSYPSIADTIFYFALLPIWSHLFFFMRQRFTVFCSLACCTLLAPTLWYLWIYSGSANANFYFAITLVFNTAQVFFLTDVLSAFIKREYYLKNGVKYNDDGSLVLMRLQ